MRQTSSASIARLHLPRLKEIALAHPDEEEAWFSYVLAFELGRVRAGAFDSWLDLNRRFPKCEKAWRYIVRWYYREHKVDQAQAFIEEVLPGTPEKPEDLLEKAELFAEIRDLDAARNLIETFNTLYPEDGRGVAHLARRLREHGRGQECASLLETLPPSRKLPTNWQRFADETRVGMNAIRSLLPPGAEETEDTSSLAFSLAIEQFIGIRKPAPVVDSLGRVALITGSLGAGGAERQLARTGIRLMRAKREGVALGGVTPFEDVDIVIKSLQAAEGHDFFLPPVRRENVTTVEIDDLPPSSFNALNIEVPYVNELLPLIPSNAIYGVKRLVEYFRQNNTQVAYIWQDGAVLFAGLAALIAGVPRIILSIRGQPPSLRQHLFHPAYPLMYKALTKVPGVYFASNSKAAAEAYSEWIGMPARRFNIVYNGVLVVEKDPHENDHKRWANFIRKTGGENVPTIGSVFRFDTDKRPALWMDFAKRYLTKFPETRIVLVGGGRMLPAAREQAARDGIADRVLFTGQSEDVGFWLKKMEAFILMSRYEGLPNAIIEAQLCGVPIVSTPAGGAAEAFGEGVTGRVLSSVDPVDLDECCAKVHEVLGWRRHDPEAAARIRTYAEERFSTETMIVRTARLLAGHLDMEV